MIYEYSMLNAIIPSSSCPAPENCRTFFDIVWGCLGTIFACTWLAVHPNVPAPGQTQLGLVFRRLGMMLLAIIAPELIVFFAVRQYFFARAFSKKFGVSRTHGFFFTMGGFVSADGQYPITTTLAQLEDPVLGRQFLADIRAIDSGIIMDKSKGDALSKLVALLQSGWFILQCIARFQQHLPITELEVATVAFAAVNVVIWILWFHKPLAVQFPIPIGQTFPKTSLAVGNCESNGPAKPFRILTSILTAIYGSVNDNHRASSAVPMLWSPSMDATFHHAFYLEVSVAMVFGAVHYAAWNASLPSVAEKWLWRSSSLIITIIPALMGIVQVRGPQGFPKSKLVEVSFMGTVLVCVVSRLLLIVLPFTTLRRIPAGALSDVDWSSDIPHF